MASASTPLRKRPYPAESDVPDVAADLKSLATALDNAPTVTQGTLANRPTTGMAAGDRYYVKGDTTLTNNGIEWIYDGSTWVQIGGESPVGTIAMFAGAAPADTSWLLCDGRALSRTQYAVLYSIIGNMYGAGDGSSTFNLPDMRQRFPLGAKVPGQSGSGSVLGEKGGQIDHTHGIPGLTVPSLGIPALAVGVSGSLPASGWAAIGFASNAGFWGAVPTPSWKDNWALVAGGEPLLQSQQTAGTHTYGASVAATATGALYGGTSASSTGGGVTGTGTSSAQNPPYLTVNYIIRVS